MVPGHLVPHNWSPIDWSLWTNGPQPILSPWTNGPQKFGPHGQMVPNQFGSPGQMVPRIFCLSKGQAVIIWKYGDQIGWGPFVQGDQIFGDHLSRGTGSGGPEVWGSNGFGTKCVAASILPSFSITMITYQSSCYLYSYLTYSNTCSMQSSPSRALLDPSMHPSILTSSWYSMGRV